MVTARSLGVRLNKFRIVKKCNRTEDEVVLFASVQDIFKTTRKVFYKPYLVSRYFLTQQFSLIIHSRRIDNLL